MCSHGDNCRHCTADRLRMFAIQLDYEREDEV